MPQYASMVERREGKYEGEEAREVEERVEKSCREWVGRLTEARVEALGDGEAACEAKVRRHRQGPHPTLCV